MFYDALKEKFSDNYLTDWLTHEPIDTIELFKKEKREFYQIKIE